MAVNHPVKYTPHENRCPVCAAKRRLEDVADAAVAWWRMHRPEWWTEAEHRRYPAVNCPTECEKSLARAVARYRDE